MKLGALIDALELLVEEKMINTKVDTNSDELQNIVAEILDTIYQSAQINELEKKIRHAMSIDIATLEKALKLIKEAKPKQMNLNEKYHMTIKPKEILDDFDEFIDHYNKNKTNNKNTIYKVEIFYDFMFDKILSTFQSGNEVFTELKKLLIKKLDVLDDKTAQILWSKIKACFGGDEKTAIYKIYDDIFPVNFFTSRNKMNVREKCAEVLVKYKPLTYRKMFEDGTNRDKASFFL